MLDVEQYHGIRGSTAREIAATAELAIRDGRLSTGEALPTVRRLASALGTSPATVNSAYRTLRQRGLVIAAGRRGTRVAPRPALRAPARPAATPRVPGRRDLTIGLADPKLLAPIGDALARIDLDKLGLEGPDPDLIEIAAASFAADSVPTQALTVVAGALDGVERVLQAHLRPGDRVVIEDPAYPPIRDILIALGLVPVPVPVDDRGLVPQELAAALARGAQAAIVVPRAQNPYGSALDGERAAALGKLLGRHRDVLLVLDDHASAVAGAPFVSLVAEDSPRWAVIRSTSKILHPDLRLALLAGDETTVARVEGRLALGPRWVSHILQATAAELMRDPSFATRSDHASETYGLRRTALIDALAEHGIEAHGRSGLNVWVPVREETPVVRALLEHDWVVLAGESFRFGAPPGLRITTSTLSREDAAEVAAIIAAAEHAGRPRRAY